MISLFIILFIYLLKGCIDYEQNVNCSEERT